MLYMTFTVLGCLKRALRASLRILPSYLLPTAPKLEPSRHQFATASRLHQGPLQCPFRSSQNARRPKRCALAICTINLDPCTRSRAAPQPTGMRECRPRSPGKKSLLPLPLPIRTDRRLRGPPNLLGPSPAMMQCTGSAQNKNQSAIGSGPASTWPLSSTEMAGLG